MALAPGLFFTQLTDAQASYFILSVATLSILDRFAPRPTMTKPLIDDGSAYLNRLTVRGAAVAFISLAGFLAVCLTGCTAAPKTPPVDDRIGDVRELTEQQNKHIDEASTSNKTALDYVREARRLAEKLFSK